MKALKAHSRPNYGPQAMLLHIGKRDFSITCFGAANPTRKSGYTSAIILSALDRQKIGKNGHTMARFSICNFTTRAFDSVAAVSDCRTFVPPVGDGHSRGQNEQFRQTLAWAAFSASRISS